MTQMFLFSSDKKRKPFRESKDSIDMFNQTSYFHLSPSCQPHTVDSIRRGKTYFKPISQLKNSSSFLAYTAQMWHKTDVCYRKITHFVRESRKVGPDGIPAAKLGWLEPSYHILQGGSNHEIFLLQTQLFALYHLQKRRDQFVQVEIVHRAIVRDAHIAREYLQWEGHSAVNWHITSFNTSHLLLTVYHQLPYWVTLSVWNG